jgi:phasin
MTENVAREFVEKGAAQAKETYGKVQAAAKESTEVMEQTLSTATKGVADFNSHLLEIAQKNMNAAFDFARQATRVKSPAEFMELSTAHARKQFETFAEQTKQLTTLAQKVTNDAAQPLQTGVAKIFNKNSWRSRVARGYSRFCELYRAWEARLWPTMQQSHVAGERMFVDYAGTTLVIDASTGRWGRRSCSSPRSARRVLPSEPKRGVEAENAALRRQLAILQRKVRSRVRLVPAVVSGSRTT